MVYLRMCASKGCHHSLLGGVHLFLLAWALGKLADFLFIHFTQITEHAVVVFHIAWLYPSS
jgi:hypothetical protein